MVWSQGLTPEQVIDPRMAYQGPGLPGPQESQEFTDNWNGCQLNEASVVHWHGSRNADVKLQLMQSVNDQLGIPEIPVNPRATKTLDISHYS
jgi:hypothetical protein